MPEKKGHIRGIACGIFKKEIESLVQKGLIDQSFKYLDSMLHMSPAKLEIQIEKHITHLKDKKILIVYGDCQPSMTSMNKRPNICRVSGMNCCEIILGKKEYKRLRSQGAFFLLPEWTLRWEEVFKKQLGFNQENARSFMRELHTKLIYLDTGVSPVPEKALMAASTFCNLPFEIMSVDLSHLLKVVLDAIERLNHIDDK